MGSIAFEPLLSAYQDVRRRADVEVRSTYNLYKPPALAGAAEQLRDFDLRVHNTVLRVQRQWRARKGRAASEASPPALGPLDGALGARVGGEALAAWQTAVDTHVQSFGTCSNLFGRELLVGCPVRQVGSGQGALHVQRPLRDPLRGRGHPPRSRGPHPGALRPLAARAL
eukprot:SRR837773.8624.p1 GENE.SRR837773.8624~~SRR837773.8624.p1  ORF type:complete len:191 (-),score=29.84 SRR837773.8624:301-810(-)